jgi:4-hydroxy-tetrahydrodipicolinate synthase
MNIFQYNSAMTVKYSLDGIYAACLTPLQKDFSIDLKALPDLLQFLASRGCHGALLFGTTGEGPSFSAQERLKAFKMAAKIRETLPDFILLAGTGTPSLDETIQLTRSAFNQGFDGVVVLPPYYFRQVSEQGLFNWFDQVLRKAVPRDGALFGYHIPHVSGVPISIELISRLMDSHAGRFAGLKDSSGDPEHAHELGHRFGKDLIVLNGNDRLFTHALESQASGCITALANVISPELRYLWDSFHRHEVDTNTQERVTAARMVMDRYPPAPPLLKYLIWQLFNLPYWPVRPPLLTINEEIGHKAALEISKILSTSLDIGVQ